MEIESALDTLEPEQVNEIKSEAHGDILNSEDEVVESAKVEIGQNLLIREHDDGDETNSTKSLPSSSTMEPELKDSNERKETSASEINYQGDTLVISSVPK